MTRPENECGPAVTAHLPAYVLDNSGVCDQTRHRLAIASDLPNWTLSEPESMVPSDRYLRLWELVEHETGDAAIAVRAARAYTPGQLGIIDYLLLTAPTLGAGLALSSRFMEACSTNFELTASADEDPDGNTTIDTVLKHGGGRGCELTMQTGLGGLIVKMRKATGRHVVPQEVHLRQRPACGAELTELIELFGTRRIEFGAATNRVVVPNADLAAPLLRADPVLNGILTQRAEMMAPPRVLTWSDRLQQELSQMLDDDGPITIDTVARRLLTGRRTLQRRLAEEDTSWRNELERARRRQITDQPADITQAERARRIGYADARSLRRAQVRWRTVS
ncbi:AraC family transcriptional regulator ligand-binding domain-containing protein [Nocardia terrae]|nr:AraC family transcriptional regulator ligand-binding domain-containing protein [Nocardia terrae]